MPAKFRVVIVNKTSVTQDYSVFSDRLIVSGGASGDAWCPVVSAAKVPNAAQVAFDLPSNYFAVCGNFSGDPDLGSELFVTKAVPISLGSQDNGSVTLGSTVNLVVDNTTTCDFATPVTPGAGKLGGILIDTKLSSGHEFKVSEAKTHNLFIGLGASRDDDPQNVKILGAFTPFPNSKYHIRPRTSFQISAGQAFAAGQLVKPEMLENTMAIDFALRAQAEVKLVHDEYNQFTFVMD